MSHDAIDWRPTATLDVLKQRAQMLTDARAFFARLNVLEVETPALTTSGVTDPNIASIECRLAARPQQNFYLQTSPEYAMKRLLAAGGPDIYQICRVFRNQELGARHQPEFTMIEWYRKNFDLDAMIDETCALITTMLEVKRPDTGQSPVERHRYRDLFMNATGLDPFTTRVDALTRCARELIDAVSTDLIRHLGSDRSAWLDLLMSHVVVPTLPRERLIAVHHYPAEQAALARLDPDDTRVAERFEIFFHGLELANGYRELLDAREQRERFEDDRQRRAAAGLADMPPDDQLLAALEHGLPDCCGVAVGFDRVVMSAGALPTLASAMSFGHAKNAAT